MHAAGARRVSLIGGDGRHAGQALGLAAQVASCTESFFRLLAFCFRVSVLTQLEQVVALLQQSLRDEESLAEPGRFFLGSLSGDNRLTKVCQTGMRLRLRQVDARVIS